MWIDWQLNTQFIEGEKKFAGKLTYVWYSDGVPMIELSCKPGVAHRPIISVQEGASLHVVLMEDGHPIAKTQPSICTTFSFEPFHLFTD